MDANDLLDAAISGGSPEEVEKALKSGANPDGKGGVTPLHRATARCDAEIVKILLAKGANPSKTDDDGETPRVWASWAGYHEIEQMLARAEA